MAITFDPAKNQANIKSRNLSFERASEINFADAIHLIDDRKEYGEVRRIAVGYLGNRLHMLCYTVRDGNMHVISFRKANIKEARKYGKPQKTSYK